MRIKRQALFWSCLFLSIVGFTLHIHQLFAMAASLALLPLISRLLSRRKLEQIAVERRAPQAANCGEQVRVDLTVRNDGRTRKIFFAVDEHLPVGLTAEQHQEFPVAILGAGEETVLQYKLQPTRRGAYPLGPVVLSTGDAVGLQQYRRELPTVSELVVYPQALHLPYSWPTAQGGQQPVRPRRRLRGQGDDFYAVRDYVPGDDPRHINWKTTARRGELTVVQYERPESLQGMILLDTESIWQAGTGDRHTLEYGVVLAASLAEQAYERGSTVGLIAGEGDVFCLASLGEEDQRLRLYEALARVAPDGKLPLLSVVEAHRDLLPPRCAVAVISPSPVAGPVGVMLRGLGHGVAWFALEAGSFGGRRGPGYGGLMMELAGARCDVRTILGNRPLQANWSRAAAWSGGERVAAARS